MQHGSTPQRALKADGCHDIVREIDRRSFLASAAVIGGAFVLGFEFPIRADTAGPEINAWVIIHPDESVTLRYPRAEMGQGSYTALPMMLPELS